jgi:hypothetical protein
MAIKIRIKNQVLFGIHGKIGIYCDECGEFIESIDDGFIVFPVNFGDAKADDIVPMLTIHRKCDDDKYKDYAWAELERFFSYTIELGKELHKKTIKRKEE